MRNQSPTDEELIRRLTSLPREIAPMHDGWLAIAGRIAAASATGQPGNPATRSRHFAVAAAVLFALAAGLVIDRQHSGSEPTAPGAERSTDLATGRFYVLKSGADSELEYRAAFREFLALNGVRAIPVGTKPARMDLGWEATRQAEIALTAALRNEPENIFLAERLHALRARQLELLQTLAALELASRRNAI
ncbi:MAG TPA: hypothetical protein VI566_08685 [Xanthomonadales bacterium]|nr:hypothetical protein [Xanthomonadales bacterium]